MVNWWVMQVLFRATANKHPDKGLIAHSDRGSQYCTHDYQRLLKQFGLVTSMSRKGDCYDNAPMESFWGILKTELVHHRRFKTRQQAIQEITEYIEIFYNRQRKQERLGYLSPAKFTQQYYANLSLLKPLDSIFDSTYQFGAEKDNKKPAEAGYRPINIRNISGR